MFWKTSAGSVGPRAPMPAAESLTRELQVRIDAVVARTSQAAASPRVLQLEWADPLMCGGHWVVEMVELAGGTNCFGHKDHGSSRLEWPDVVASQPEVVILMPCGFGLERSLEDMPILAEKEGLGHPAGGAGQPGLRHRRQRLHQPVGAQADHGPGNNGRNHPPGAVLRHDSRRGRGPLGWGGPKLPPSVWEGMLSSAITPSLGGEDWLHCPSRVRDWGGDWPLPP